MLSINPSVYNEVMAAYPELNLAANQAKTCNVIEVTAAQLTETNLRNAIITARTTAGTSFSLELSGSTLLIEGTNGADWIEIGESASQIIVYAYNSTGTTELNQWRFAKNSIATIEFNGYDGNDTYKNYTAVNDVLDGGNGNNLLLGGTGTTTLNNTGIGSNCFAVNGNSVQWVSESSLGKDDSLIFFATVDRYGRTMGSFNSSNDIRYVAWTTANIDNVLATVSSVYGSIGNYGYFRNNNTGNGEIYMMVSDSYNVLGNVYGYNSGGDMVYRENAVNSRLTIHEVGHNWDSSAENPFFAEFAAISYNGNVLKADAVAGDFAFGTLGIGGAAYEDWAYTISLVFGGYGTDNQSSVAATSKYLQKVDVINRFGAWLGGANVDVPAPTGLASPSQTQTSITLSWTAVGSAVSYILQRSTDGTNWTQIGGTITTNSYTDNTSLTADTNYHYRLAAVNAAGTSAWSSPVQVKTRAAEDSTIPGSSIATALPVTFADGIFSTIQNIRNDGVHIYQIAVTADDIGKMYDFHASQPSGAAEFDTYLRLFDAGGTQLAFDDDGGTEYYSRLIYTFSTPGTYYLGVCEYYTRNYNPNAATPGTGSPTELYALSIQVGAGVPDLLVGNLLNLSGAKTLDNTALDWDGALNNNRYVVVAFVASWCPYSQRQLDELRSIYPTYQSQGLEIISAYTGGSGLSDSIAQVAEKNIPWINITDHFLDINYSNYYDISGYPRSVVVDCASGKIIRVFDGFASGWISSYLVTLDWSAVSRPAAPTDLASPSQTQTSINLSWNPSTNATSYDIQYRQAGTTMWTSITGVTETSKEITGLSVATEYEFQVRATSSGGSSAWTPTTPLRTTTLVVPPTIPVDFRSTDQTSHSVTLSWNAQSNLTGYTLEYKKSTDSTWTTWTPAPETNATGATITDLVANTTYNFQLTATNTGGSASSTANASTPYDSLPTINMPDTGSVNVWTIRKNGENIEVIDAANEAVFTQPDGTFNHLVINASGTSNDRLTIDFSSAGSFLLGYGVEFNGSSNHNESLAIIGSDGDGVLQINIDATELNYGGLPIYLCSIEQVNIDGREGFSQVWITGSDGDDTLIFNENGIATFTTPATVYTTVNMAEIFVDGLGGNDKATIIGSETNGLYSMGDNSFVMQAGGYRVDLRGFNRIDAFADGHRDKAYVSGQNNSLVSMNDQYVERRGEGQAYRIWRSEQIIAINMDDTNNAIIHSGSRSFDNYTIAENYGSVTNANGSYFHEWFDFTVVNISSSSASISLPDKTGGTTWTPLDDRKIWQQNDTSVTIFGSAKVNFRGVPFETSQSSSLELSPDEMITQSLSSLQLMIEAPVTMAQNDVTIVPGWSYASSQTLTDQQIVPDMDLVSPTQLFDINVQTVTPVVANLDIAQSNTITSSNAVLLSEDELLYAWLAEEQQRASKKKLSEIFDDADNWLEDFEELALLELKK